MIFHCIFVDRFSEALNKEIEEDFANSMSNIARDDQIVDPGLPSYDEARTTEIEEIRNERVRQLLENTEN